MSQHAVGISFIILLRRKSMSIFNRVLFLLVGFNLQVECPVIDKAAAAESLGKQNLLFFCRIDSIFIGSQRGDFI